MGETTPTVPGTEPEITAENLGTFLKTHSQDAQIKGLVGDYYPISSDYVDKWIVEDDGKKWLQSITDKRVTEGIKTYETNQLPRKLQEQENKIRLEINPQETQSEKDIRELKKKMLESEGREKKQEVLNYTLQQVNELGLEQIGQKYDLFVKDTKEETQAFLNWLKDRDNFIYEKGRNSILKQKGHSPEGGEETEKMAWQSLDEYGNWLKRNPGKYDQKVYTKLANK